MTDTRPDPLPESVAAVAEVIGRAAALHLAGSLPPVPSKPWKGHAYIPTVARLSPDHVLVEILGWKDAVRLARAYGGEVVHISKCRGIERAHRNRRIWELRGEGLSSVEIGDVLDVRAETVKKVLQLGPPAADGKAAMVRSA